MNGFKAVMTGECTPGDGPDLKDFPSLTYAPGQWGEGVRLARNGQPISDVIVAAQASGITDLLNRMVQETGFSFDEVFDALQYAKANPEA